MKKILIVWVLLVCWSCYEDDLVVLEDEQNNLHKASKLTNLLKGVSSHNTTFDQFLDGSNCFSIEFPYQLMVENGDIFLIENENDLVELASHNHNNFEFLYPIQIKTADYIQHQVEHKNQHLDLLTQCENDEMFKDHIDCASLQYPIKLSVSHINHQRFEEIQLKNAEELYRYLANLSDGTRYKINYPVNIFTFNDDIHDQVNHNQNLLVLILEASQHKCKVIE